MEEIDLYETLGVERTASQTEIKKAYHKAALSHHPDKVPEDEREAAGVKFKVISRAYEILYDDQQRHLYDTHGMSAFDGRQPPASADFDLNDILAQMMGMGGGGGMPPGFGGPQQPDRPQKGKDEQQDYAVCLEDLYKGKVVKFASTKDILCSHCHGTGGKEKAKPRQCSSCSGRGIKQRLKSIGPGMVTKETFTCDSCNGTTKVYNAKDRCRKCQGSCVMKSKKMLELYIPRGSKAGDVIRLEGEADQEPNQEPGDIVFRIQQDEHPTFTRVGSDLTAQVTITLAEALGGISRVIIQHLDGRGIHVQYPNKASQKFTPGTVLKIQGEGMPHKKGESKGDLYLEVEVSFPDYAWLAENERANRLLELLPKPDPPVKTDITDSVEYTEVSDMDDIGKDDVDAGWEDEDGDDDGQPQCQQQ